MHWTNSLGGSCPYSVAASLAYRALCVPLYQKHLFPLMPLNPKGVSFSRNIAVTDAE